MICKWLCAFGFAACTWVHAAPVLEESTLPTSGDVAQAHVLHNPLHSMGQSVASHTTDVISTAMQLIGIPYRRGGSSAQTGFDCSGFVRAVYHDTVGHLLPRKASEQAKVTKKIDKKELQPGDLVFFNTMRRAFSHVGIYVGDGKFIHSPSRGKRVRIESMRDSYWVKRFNGARRVPVGAAPAAPSLASAELLEAVADDLLPSAAATAP